MSTLGLKGYFKQREEGPTFSPGEEYKYEAVRIVTFVGWPTEYKERPSCLARNGLYWTHDDDEVKCFSCHASLRGCVSGGTVDEAHRGRATRCRMLAGTDEDNIPLLPAAMNKQEAMKGLPIIPIPTEGILADIIASHNARRKPGNEADSDFLWDAYLRRSQDSREAGPATPYMQPTGQANALTTFLPDGHHTTSLNKADLSVPHPFLLKREEERMKTFSSWPARERVDPVELVKAGLYYFGVSDRVKCAFCHNVLQKWVMGDVPLEEHKTLFPKCPFVQGLSVGNVHAGDQQPQTECGYGDSFFGNVQEEEDPTQPQQSTRSLQEAPGQEDCEEIAPGARQAPPTQMQEQSPHAASTSGGENIEDIEQVHQANENPQDDSSEEDDGLQQQQQQPQQQKQLQEQQQLGLEPGYVLDVSSAEGVAESSGILLHEISGMQEENGQGLP